MFQLNVRQGNVRERFSVLEFPGSLKGIHYTERILWFRIHYYYYHYYYFHHMLVILIK